jgi:hypothetical protein
MQKKPEFRFHITTHPSNPLAECHDALLRGLLAHRRQNRTQLREEWVGGGAWPIDEFRPHTGSGAGNDHHNEEMETVARNFMHAAFEPEFHDAVVLGGPVRERRDRKLKNDLVPPLPRRATCHRGGITRFFPDTDDELVLAGKYLGKP